MVRRGQPRTVLMRNLQSAFRDEWSAAYQYRVYADELAATATLFGQEKRVESEFREHFEDELHHAELISEYLLENYNLQAPKRIELKPLMCSPRGVGTRKIIEKYIIDTIFAERVAMQTYDFILNLVEDSGDSTIITIMQEIVDKEKEHLTDLQGLYEALGIQSDGCAVDDNTCPACGSHLTFYEGIDDEHGECSRAWCPECQQYLYKNR